MLMTRGLSSLGTSSWVAAMPTMIQHAADAAATGSSAYVPQGSNVQRYTAGELETQYRAFVTKWTNDQLIEAWGLAARLPTCPPNAQTKPTSCYTGAAPNLLPAGTFIAYGVPFNVGEFRKDERFSFLKTVSADDTQRQVIERAVRLRSNQVFWKLLYQAMAERPTLQLKLDGLTIKQAQGLVPQFRVTDERLKYNPIFPTRAESDEYGGLSKWIARGGFPIVSGVIDGTISLDEAVSPVVCQSILCRCPGVASTTSNPVTCVRARVTKSGAVSQNPGYDTASFWVFFKFLANGQITVALDYAEPSMIKKIGEAMAGVFTSIGNMLCMAAPVAKDQMAAMALPKCVDKDKKPCKQGTAGCTCVTPPNSTQAAIGTTNFIMQKWCEDWTKDTTPPADFPIDNIMPPVQPQTNWWPWIIGGLAVAGGIALASRK